MRKYILVFILFFLFICSHVNAHPWRTDSSGGHYCRTNCSSWWEIQGAWHSHNWWSNYTTPSYVTPTYTVPKTCADSYGFWAKENLAWKCECRLGYKWWKDVLWKDKCVDGDTYCRDTYWWNSEYSYLNEGCQCKDDYYVKETLSWQTCASMDSYCSDKYSYGSDYDSTKETCTCKINYKWEEDSLWTLKCAYNSDVYSWTPVVNETKCWLNSSSDGDWGCSCNTGYIWADANDDKNLDCKKEIVKTPNQACEELYWNNIYWDGTKSDNWWYLCYCNTWYFWEKASKSCVMNEVEEIEEAPHNIDNSIKEKVDKIFPVLKSKFSKYSDNQKISTYKKLQTKINTLLNKKTISEANRDLLNYLNHLIWDEIEKINSAGDFLNELLEELD